MSSSVSSKRTCPAPFESRFGFEGALTEDFGVSRRDGQLGLAGRPTVRGIEEQGSDGQGGAHQDEQRDPDAEP
jgi:hypothetical protein